MSAVGEPRIQSYVQTNPIFLVKKYVREQPKELYKGFINAVSWFSYLTETLECSGYFKGRGLEQVQNLKRLTCDAKSIMAIPELIGLVCSTLESSQEITETLLNENKKGLDVFDAVTKGVANVSVTIAKVCEVARFFDKKNIVDVPGCSLLAKGQHAGNTVFLIIKIGNCLDNLLIRNEKWQNKKLGEAKGGGEEFDIDQNTIITTYTIAELLDLCKYCIGFIVCALLLAAAIIGFSIASPLMLTLATLGLILTLLAFFVSESAEFQKGQYINPCKPAVV
ncbi:MAG: hypothetical protein WDZ28_04110 [Simkaniaceae bacterium]